MVSRARSILMALTVLAISSTSSVYASGICFCPPKVSGQVNQNPIPSGTFAIISLAEGYNIYGAVADPTYSLALNVTTNPDPSIAFDLAISGDPTVQLTITQVYLGGPFPNLVINAFGGLSDGNGDGIATLTDAFVRTTVTGQGIAGSLVSQIDLNCVATGPAFFQNLPCLNLVPASLGVSTSDFVSGVLQVDIQFTLSDFDAVTVNGSSVLSGTTAVPEPASLLLLGTAVGGAILRRRARTARA
jgi:hypothetical protein